MYLDANPITNALCGTVLTWAATALGAACVFFIPKSLHPRSEKRFLDLSLGFAGGVMLAASFWSLLDPAFTFARQQGWKTDDKDLSWVPVAIGFFAGAAFVLVTDVLLPEDSDNLISMISSTHEQKSANTEVNPSAPSARSPAKRRGIDDTDGDQDNSSDTDQNELRSRVKLRARGRANSKSKSRSRSRGRKTKGYKKPAREVLTVPSPLPSNASLEDEKKQRSQSWYVLIMEPLGLRVTAY